MYKKGFDGWRKHLDFIVIDMLCMVIALWGAFITRHGFKEAYIGHIPYYMHLMVILIAITNKLLSILSCILAFDA